MKSSTKSSPTVDPKPKTVGEFQALPTVASQFPIVIREGAHWDTFTGYCKACDAELDEDKIRGHVTQPFESTFDIEAWGMCDCGTMSSFNFRFLPDMSMVGRSTTGEWSIWPRGGPRQTFQ